MQGKYQAFVEDFIDSGELLERLKPRIAIPSISQNCQDQTLLYQYLEEIIIPELSGLGFKTEIILQDDQPFLIAERIEADDLPTILMYGHGDVVPGQDTLWQEGLTPWNITVLDGKWYGRGIADNKGQHTVNFVALEIILKEKGALGFNCKILFEMGEELASPGLEEVVLAHKDRLKADLFIASDGPRVSAEVPTLFLGSRGCLNIELKITARDQGYHSGNWGGLLSNPAIELMHGITQIVSESGEILIDALKPPVFTETLQQILREIPLSFSETDPKIHSNWGEKGFTASEQLFGWNTFEVLSFIAGNPENPINAIPHEAIAVCQLRFVVGTDIEKVIPAIEQVLIEKGFSQIKVSQLNFFPATRFNPEHPLISWILMRMEEATGKVPALLPNIGGSIPNHPFSEYLNLPTLWIPHSYPACGQHGPNEHFLPEIAREGLSIMVHLFDQIGENTSQILKLKEDTHLK